MKKKQLLLVTLFIFGICASHAQVSNPFLKDGMYTLVGSTATSHQEVRIQKVPQDQSNNMDEIYYSAGAKVSGVVYTITNHQVSSVGQMKEGKKHGIWAYSGTIKKNEDEFGHIFELVYFENNLKTATQIISHDDQYTHGGAYKLNGLSLESSVLFDLNEEKLNDQESDFQSGIYENRKPYNGPFFFNYSGALRLVANIENGYMEKLCIVSNESLYIMSFGEMEKGKKEGLWINNQYSGQPNSIGSYKNDQKNGTFIYFDQYQFRQIGKATFKNDEMVNYSGTCNQLPD
jgi:antitoxin component YwqK of YwqJK toxin-antitoxin module